MDLGIDCSTGHQWLVCNVLVTLVANCFLGIVALLHCTEIALVVNVCTLLYLNADAASLLGLGGIRKMKVYRGMSVLWWNKADIIGNVAADSVVEREWERWKLGLCALLCRNVDALLLLGLRGIEKMKVHRGMSMLWWYREILLRLPT